MVKEVIDLRLQESDKDLIRLVNGNKEVAIALASVSSGGSARIKLRFFENEIKTSSIDTGLMSVGEKREFDGLHYMLTSVSLDPYGVRLEVEHNGSYRLET